MPKTKESVTDAELALLTLLAEQPMHGYQLEQTIEERGMRAWTEIGFSSIYYILDKLKDKGWLNSTLESSPGKGPARQVYNLTVLGKRIWKKAALDALAHPHRTYSNFHLGIANLLALPPGEVLPALRENFDQLQERYVSVKTKLDGYGDPLPWEVERLFNLSLTQIRCEMDWAAQFIKDYEGRHEL
jgi:DNA-binding PadR family transcriptional regulator